MNPELESFLPLAGSDEFGSWTSLLRSAHCLHVLFWIMGPRTSKAQFLWAKRRGVKLHFIQSGKPTQHACVARFHGRFRDYCLDLHWFASLEDATEDIDIWRDHDKNVRPHQSLGRKPLAVFAKETA